MKLRIITALALSIVIGLEVGFIAGITIGIICFLSIIIPYLALEKAIDSVGTPEDESPAYRVPLDLSEEKEDQ